MTRQSLAGILLATVLGLLSAACGGSSSPDPGPGPGPGPGFDRLTAVVTDAMGNAMSGLSVRVDGQATGIATDDSGRVVLTAANFPGGVNSTAEIAFGKGGIVLGSREVIPAQNPSLTVQFTGGAGGGSASVRGTVYDGGTRLSPANGETTTDMLPAPQVIANAEVTLFDAAAGAVFQTKTDASGQYSFSGVAAGSWQMSAQSEGYYPEMAALRVEEGADLRFDFALHGKGLVAPGEGLKVRGTLVDSVSGDPVAGATVNLYADTGYYYIDPMPGELPPGPGGNGGSVPGSDGDVVTSKGGSMLMIAPDIYRPQYQTTTTGSDGRFSFPDEVAGYSLWLDYSAPNYLAGNHYEDINGRGSDLNLSLSLSPVIPTGVHGRVVNGSGSPVAGARVEFVFGGGYMGGGTAVPGFINFADMASNGRDQFDSIGAPPPARDTPPMAPGSPNGWDESSSAPQAGGGAAAPGGGSAGSGSGFDNNLMQRFLWEQQQKGASDVAADFNGYVCVYTDANGEYSVSDIPAGPYYVMASAYRHLPFAGEAQLGPDDATNELDVTLPEVPVGSVVGKVTDENGNPVPDVLVNATQPNVDPFTYTDASGNYRIDNVPAGEWLISAFKSGYLTASQTTPIDADGVARINLQLNRYAGPDATTIAFSGRAINGYDNSYVGGADIVFTPVDETLGGYARHVQSGSNGSYSTTLVPNTDFNVLIQKSGYEDIFFRFWIDELNPRMDFWLWPIGAPGGSGGWNGGGPVPMPGTDPATGGGGDADDNR